MQGAEFFELSQRLASGTTAAEMRTATSRAYYAAFHKASELMRSIGILLPLGPECHTKVLHLLSHSEDADVVTAGSRLTALRSARNAADYELNNPDAEQKKPVYRHLRRAKEIMDSIDACFAGGTKASVHEPIRKYARDVLRLPVL